MKERELVAELKKRDSAAIKEIMDFYGERLFRSVYIRVDPRFILIPGL